MWPILFADGSFVVYTHDLFTLLGLAVGLTIYPALIMGFWGVVLAADVVWLFALGQRLPS